MKKIDPFTRTPGIAGKAYIEMRYEETIIDNFKSSESSKYVYKIVGLRGSGKSVVFSKIIQAFKGCPGWLVYTLPAAGTPIETLIAKMSEEKFVNADKTGTSIGASANIAGDLAVLNGAVTVSYSKNRERNDRYYSSEAELLKLVTKANEKGYRILVGIDDIAKTEKMVEFLSLFGSMLLEGKQIYLLCTGLSKNIEDFSGEPNLTFFRRSDSIETGTLDRYDVAGMYQKLLGVSVEESVKLAKFVQGYAYAYQVLGSLYYNREEGELLADLIPDFDRVLFRDSYDLIWKSLSTAEKELVKIIVSSSGRASEIKGKMESPKSFNSLRDRLEKKHLVNAEERGVVRINLPRFKEFIDLWEDE